MKQLHPFHGTAATCGECGEPATQHFLFPLVHLNGTSARTLTEDYLNAATAIGAALVTLNQIEFNSRDYYPKSDTAWAVARAEQSERARRLEAVRRELEAIAEYCSDFIKS